MTRLIYAQSQIYKRSQENLHQDKSHPALVVALLANHETPTVDTKIQFNTDAMSFQMKAFEYK